MKLDYVMLTTGTDGDIPYLLTVYELPEISRFISIDKHNYFSYVSNNPNVTFYKVYHNGTIVGTLHIEVYNSILYMSVLVLPQYQQNGIGTRIIKDIQQGNFPFEFQHIEISIDESNIASKKLFEKLGFVFISKEDELLNYSYTKRYR